MFFKARKDKADNNNVLGRLISKLSSQPSSTGDREYTELRSRHKEYLLRASQESNSDGNGDDSGNADILSSTEGTASTNAIDTTPTISSSHLRKKIYIDSTDGVLSTEQYSSDGALPLNSEMSINPSDSELPESEPGQKSIDGSGLESIDMESCEEKTDDTPFDIPFRQRIQRNDLPGTDNNETDVVLDEQAPEYHYPPVELLACGASEDLNLYARKDRELAETLEATLSSFGIAAKLIGITHGPAETRFELQLAKGVRVSSITSLKDDLALNLAVMRVRIDVPIPGKQAVGISIPNDKVETVHLRDILESPEAKKQSSSVAVCLGKGSSGRCVVADIAQMPHALIAGQTGSGKSTCLHSIIMTILFRASPDDVRMVLIDPQAIELSIYNDIPHLLCPVVTDPKKAISTLDWTVAEMNRRKRLFAGKGVWNIERYNRELFGHERPMPRILVIIHELADLMMLSRDEAENSISQLGQMGAATGIHLIISTFRPHAEIFTGSMRNVIPTRIAFATASSIDSRMILGLSGAENLSSIGDMLFLLKGDTAPLEVWGSYATFDEIRSVVEYIKTHGKTHYDPDMIEHMVNSFITDAEKEEFVDAYDPKLPEAVDIVLDMGQVSISMLQRRMRIGYARAGRLIDEMARRGIVSEADGSKPRSVLITREDARLMFEMDFD